MRKLVVTENITLDGVIEQVGDWFASDGGGTTTRRSTASTWRRPTRSWSGA